MVFPNIKKSALAVLALGAWTTACYWPVLRGPFFFDDEHFIQKNKLVHSLAHVGEIYTTTVTQGAAIKGNFYRPNQQLVYALLYSLVGETTTLPYHLVPVLLHAANGALLAAWLVLLGLAPVAAVAGAAVFLVHPVQTEAVAYISGLADPLGLFFMLAALVLYTRALRRGGAKQQWWALAAVAALMVLALFTKENGVVLAPLLVATTAYAWAVDGKKPTPAAAATAGLTVALAGTWSVLKLTVLNFTGDFGLTGDANAYTQDLSLRLKTFVGVLWDYAGLLVYPAQLNYEKPYRAYADLATGRGAFGAACLTAAVVAVCGVRRWPRAALAAAVIAGGLLPFTGIVPLNAMYLEHWLYVPMLGVALLVAAVVQRWAHGRARKPMLAALVVVLAAASARTMARSREWADVELFYLNEIAATGPSTRIYNNLGMYYADLHENEKAIRYYQLAVQTSGGGGVQYPQPHHNLARLYAEAGRMPETMAELHEALKVDHGFIYSLIFLHEVMVRAGDAERVRAIEAAAQAVQAGQGYDFAAFERTVFGG